MTCPWWRSVLGVGVAGFVTRQWIECGPIAALVLDVMAFFALVHVVLVLCIIRELARCATRARRSLSHGRAAWIRVARSAVAR
jgi:hypothetical protein